MTGTSRLNVNIDRDLHRALKRQALDEDTDVASIVRRLLVEYLTYTGALAPSSLDLMLQAAQESYEMTAAEQPTVRAGLPTAPPARRS